MLFDINTIYSTTEYTLDRIGKYRNGGDALLLYFRYTKQARIQDNQQTFSSDIFMEKAMSWGNDRLRHAKNVLKDLGLIETITKRDELGKIVGYYVKVNYIIDTNHVLPITPETRDRLCPGQGEQGTNTLVLKDKYPSTKDKCDDIDFTKINEEAYKEWIEYRKQIKKPMPQSTIKKQTAMLENYDFTTQKQIIDDSISAGYTGLFYEKYKCKSKETKQETKPIEIEGYVFIERIDKFGRTRDIYRDEFTNKLGFWEHGNFNIF